jgi:dTMP kinase
MTDNGRAKTEETFPSELQMPGDYLKISGGLLVAFEGIDGSGKTTMAQRTAQALCEAGYFAKYLREPTDGPHGRQLREIMVSPEARDAHQEFELFLLDRREDVAQNIAPVLHAGGIVCIDRYYISSMAYQGALGLDFREIQRANEEFAPSPDVLLYFEIPVDTALQRIAASREAGANSFEKREYLARVVETFERMNFPQMVRLDASSTPEVVFAQIQEVLRPVLSSRLDK